MSLLMWAGITNGKPLLLIAGTVGVSLKAPNSPPKLNTKSPWSSSVANDHAFWGWFFGLQVLVLNLITPLLMDILHQYWFFQHRNFLLLFISKPIDLSILLMVLQSVFILLHSPTAGDFLLLFIAFTDGLLSVGVFPSVCFVFLVVLPPLQMDYNNRSFPEKAYMEEVYKVRQFQVRKITILIICFNYTGLAIIRVDTCLNRLGLEEPFLLPFLYHVAVCSRARLGRVFWTKLVGLFMFIYNKSFSLKFFLCIPFVIAVTISRVFVQRIVIQ